MEKPLTQYDLKCGNILNYTTEEGIFPCTLDWQYIKWISENPESFNKEHSPIPLTIGLLEELGLKIIHPLSGQYSIKIGHAKLLVLQKKAIGELWDPSIYTSFGPKPIVVQLQYLHELQNLYYSLSNEMLSLKTS